ncbi:MAG TPA: MraY family glycosyltransferase [Chitinophagaceae bacterium]|nr:MraY family glycosyltransferase [Chitinophagaceae bacterium]
MKSHLFLLQINFTLPAFKSALLCFLTAFAAALIIIPPVISLIRKYRLYDLPNARKEHTSPVPTMGGIAIAGGMMISLFLWFPFSTEPAQIAFFFSVIILLALGIMDDLKDLSAKYKFLVQFSLAALVAAAGIRITSFEGLFGIYELPLTAQFSFTILAIAGITNAFNLIDGIDGLAGGIGFMSLTGLGLLLTLNGDANTGMIAFALAGGLLAFLYFNMNPARIFMGDTGSLLLGFVSAVLCIRLIQSDHISGSGSFYLSPAFILSFVWLPVFDTLRVFGTRLWQGRSPFSPDKTHIHHLLTNQGFSHAFSSRLICFIHAVILMEAFWLRQFSQEVTVIFLFCFMLLATYSLKYIGLIFSTKESSALQE